MRHQIVPRSFYEHDPLVVARSLLGKQLQSRLSFKRCGGLIVETEAYVGPLDKASHSFGGRRTARTEVQYGARGHAYIYQIYGLHCCFNIVVGEGRIPAVVLIRALRPTVGVDQMSLNRGFKATPTDLRLLTSGPGRLSEALGITKGEYGLPVWCGDLVVRHAEEGAAIVESVGVEETARINIDYAEEWVEMPWRFTVRGDPFVSANRTGRTPKGE